MSYDVSVEPISGIAYIRSGGEHESGDAAVLAALRTSARHIHFQAGTYYFGSSVTIADSNVKVSLGQGARLIPNHTGAVGLFSWTGDNGILSGPGSIILENWRNSQVVVKCSGERMVIEGTFTDMTTGDGNQSTPMVLFQFDDGVLSGDMLNNTVFPNIGLKCFVVTGVNKQRIIGNRVSNNSDVGFGGTYNGHVTLGNINQIRQCHTVIELVDPEWVEIANNFIWGLGFGNPITPPGDPIIKCIVATGTDDARELGHLFIHDNYIEQVTCPTYIELNGIEWAQIQGNFLGTAATGVYDNAAGHAAIKLDSTDGTDTGVFCNAISILNNQMHNVPYLEGCGIYVLRALDVRIQGLIATDWNADYVIRVEPTTVRNLTIDGIDASSNFAANNTTAVIRVDAGTWGSSSAMSVGRMCITRGIDPDTGLVGASAGSWVPSSVASGGGKVLLTGLLDTAAGLDPAPTTNIENLTLSINLP
jgi:hypothetical protein